MPRKLSTSVTVTIQMTRKQALEQGLLTCDCGHPENNHFDWDLNPCAHCHCKSYEERPRVGKFV